MPIDKAFFLHEIKSSLEFLMRSTRSLTEADSSFAPKPTQMNIAQQMAHIAHTVHWLLDGAFSPQGFDMNFEKHSQEIARVTSLEAAKKLVEKAYADALERVKELPESEWETPIAAGPIMGGEPRKSVLMGIIEHTAHHRGALTVYTRLLDKVPPMPYMDM